MKVSHIFIEKNQCILITKLVKSCKMHQSNSFICKISAICLFPNLEEHYFLPNIRQKRLLVFPLKVKSLSIERYEHLYLMLPST